MQYKLLVTFLVKSCVQTQDSEILMYFWSQHGYLFDENDLEYIVATFIHDKHLINHILLCSTSVQIIKFMGFESRLKYLKRLCDIEYKFNKKFLKQSL